ncbi:MAG: hypothetical protein AAF847_03955 [Bacteroidota bacterium]
MITKPFEQWLFEDVELVFDIERVKNLPALMDWLRVESIDHTIEPVFEQLRILLGDNVEIFNEDELKMMFIAPFLSHFDFHNPPHYRIFTQRKMQLKTEKVDASGKVEWMIASGKQRPRNPFFFLQEYKPEKSSGNDPLGQLLVAMVNAQRLNDPPKEHLYGCYTIGRFWFFVLLEGTSYGVSRAYDATQEDDINQMVIILKRVEDYIKQKIKI